MRKAENTISIEISRMGEAEGTFNVLEGSTLDEVLDQADITLGEAETAWVGGIKAEGKDEIQEGDIILIVGKKSGGLK